MTLRQRTNLARKLSPKLCTTKVGKSVWGMRSVSDNSKNIQVEVFKKQNVTSTSSKFGKITHGLYICQARRINKYGEWEPYFGPHALEYAVASILGEAKRNKKTVIFYADIKSVLLKKKIQNVSMIEIKCGKERIWGVVYND